MKPLKVCVFVNVFPKLSQTFVLQQIIGLLNEGFHVSIFTLRLEKEEKVHRYVGEYKLLEMVRLAQELVDSGRTHHFDIIHCHFGTSAMAACELLNRGVLHGKLLCSFHGFDVNVNLYNNTYYEPLILRGDHFTVNTNYTKARVLALGFSEEQISVLPVGVDMAHFDARHKTRKTKAFFNILTIGRLVEKKGLTYAIKAMKILRSRAAGDFHFNIIGDGPLRNELEQQIIDNGLSNVITMQGALTRDEVLEFMKVADVFILPSVMSCNGDSEGQGLVLQEAQSMEVPVVASSHNGFPDGVRDGVTGFLVPEKNPELLADKISVLMQDEPLRIEMGRQGRLFVKQNFDIKKLNQQLIQIYMSLHEGTHIQ